jgi:hypothetical protein
MKLNEQRDTLRESSQRGEDALDFFIQFLATSDKFKGLADDWIRVGEVWPILEDIKRGLRNTRLDTLT